MLFDDFFKNIISRLVPKYFVHWSRLGHIEGLKIEY